MFDYLISLPPWGHRVLALLLLFGGAGVCAWGTINLLDAYTSKDWPVATGTVLESTVTRHSVKRGRFGRAMVYRPEVTYAYRINGQDYTGDRLSWTETDYTDSADARAVASRYVPEDHVSIRYKPSDPSCSVITPGVTQGALVVPGVGIGLILFGVVLAFALGLGGRRKAQSEEEPSPGSPRRATVRDRDGALMNRRSIIRTPSPAVGSRGPALRGRFRS